MATEAGQEGSSVTPQSAAIDIRRGAAAVRQGGAGISQSRAERYALVEWASRRDLRLDIYYIEQFARVADGAEHVVYYDAGRGRAVKATHANAFGYSARGEGCAATPLEYLRRLGWHNVLFGDDIMVEGIAYHEGQIEVITSQPWIITNSLRATPTPAEIALYFMQRGFRHVDLYPDAPLYYNIAAGVLIADAHDRNVLRNEAGELSPIDVVIGRPAPDLKRRIHAHILGPELDLGDV